MSVIISFDFLASSKLYVLVEFKGKLYISKMELKVVNNSVHAKNLGYDMIDLTKGDGNYTPENIYSYNIQDDTKIHIDAPKVLDSKLYFAKDTGEIIQFDVNTKEEKVLDKVSDQNNMVLVGITLFLNKETKKLYYFGVVDNKYEIIEYDLNTDSKKVIAQDSKKYYSVFQLTNEGLYFLKISNGDSYSVELHEYVFSEEKDKLITGEPVNNIIIKDIQEIILETIQVWITNLLIHIEDQ